MGIRFYIGYCGSLMFFSLFVANSIHETRSGGSYTTGKNEIIDLPNDIPETPKSSQTVRLRGSDRNFGSGRLEIFHEDKWHVVCDKYFPSEAADVACKTLGFQNGAKSIKYGSTFGNGLLNTFLPFVFDCNGSESDLIFCQNKSKSIYCDILTETVGIECRNNYGAYCNFGEVAFGRSCYKVHNSVVLSFQQAQETCENNFGSLAVIKNQDEMNFVSELLFADHSHDNWRISLWYVGGYKTDESNAWKWKARTSIESTNFTKWKPGFKERPRRNCLALIRNQSSLENRDYYFWDSVRCNERLNFVCQRKLDFSKGCLNETNKRSFDGSVSLTINGKVCSRWNDPGIWRRRLLFREQPFMNHNFCRNPDNDRLPWCLVDVKKIEYCHVPSCLNPKSSQCNENEIQCGDEKECVPKNFLCDFDKDCSDGFDERNCVNCGKALSARKARSPNENDDDVSNLEPLPWGKVARIVGGNEASPGSYPWTVSIKVKDGNRHYCGGSLIDKFHVVTAAHCFDKDRNPSSYYVAVGEWDVEATDSTKVTFEIDQIIPHPGYKRLQEDDIAIIKLQTSTGVSFTDFVQPICLATAYTAVKSYTRCYVSGWGSNGENPASRMQAAQMPVISRKQCMEPSVYGSSLSPKAFCAGYLSGGIDTCIGDSGGPLACQINDRFFLFGIVSWGEGCAERNKPGVYTSVKEYAMWIREKTMAI